MAFETLLVDLDGTIWDSYPFYAAVIAGIADVSESTVLDALQDGGNVVHLIKNYGISRPRFINACRAHDPSMKLYPGVTETFAEASRRGIAIGSVTSLPRDISTLGLELTGLADAFDVFEPWTASGKSAAIISCLDRLRQKPGPNAIYVGDLAQDLDASKSAGISFVWASYGYGSRPEGDSYVSIESFREVLEL